MNVGNKSLYFTYDASGQPMSVIYDTDTTDSTAGTTYYYITNIQGDVIGIVDASGNQVVSYSYDAWGNHLSTSGTMATTLGQLNPLRYRGYVYDQESQLYYLQSRYYDPETGRFINADDVSLLGANGDFASLNLFAYCGNSPLNRVDYTGESFAVIIGYNFNIFGWGAVGTINFVSTKENLGIQYSYYFSGDNNANEKTKRENQTTGIDLGSYFGIQYTEKDNMEDLRGYAKAIGGDLFLGGDVLVGEDGSYLGWQMGSSGFSANMHSIETETETLFSIPTIDLPRILVDWVLGRR